MSGAPILRQRIGEELREARYRPDAQPLGPGAVFAYTVQVGDCDMDGVGVPANAISGGSIREADGSRAADTSHPAYDPARDVQAEGTRQVACAAVPAAPAPWLALWRRSSWPPARIGSGSAALSERMQSSLAAQDKFHPRNPTVGPVRFRPAGRLHIVRRRASC